MWIKKKLFCMLLLFSLHFCYAQQSQLVFTNTNTTDLWQNIDNSLNLLEQEQMFSQTRLAELEKKLEQSEKACQDKELLLQTCESSLEKSKKDTQKWKNCCLVLGGTTVTLGITTIVTILLLVNKY